MHDRTSGFFNESAFKLQILTANNTVSSFHDINPYRLALPANIDIFSDLAEKVNEIDNDSVAKQVKQILLSLYLSLQRKYEITPIDNYLSKINLLQQEDQSALLEWSFQGFRIGFTLEPNRKESSFFVISEDRNAGSFKADSQMLEDDIAFTIDRMVDYVLENT